MRRTLEALIVSTLVLFAGCGDGGNNNAFPGAGMQVAVPIGAAGGQVVSADGMLTLDIPAGALAATEMITITTLGPGQVPAGFNDPFDMSWELEPDGLTFAMPARLTVAAGTAATPSPGETEADIPILVVESAGMSALADNPGMTVDPQGQIHATADLSHFSSVNLAGGSFGRASLTVPDTIPVGQSGPVVGGIFIPAETILMAPVTATWEYRDMTPNITSDLPGVSAFAGGAPLLDETLPFTLTTDSFNLTCNNETQSATFSAFFYLDVAFRFPDGVLTTGTYTALIQDSVQCGDNPPPGPTVVVSSLAGILDGVEAPLALARGFGPCSGDVLVGGQAPGFGIGVSFVDPDTGNVESTEILTTSGTAFDAVTIRAPDGVNTLIASGQGAFINDFVPNSCDLEPFGQIFMGFREDLTIIAQDPLMGAVGASGPNIFLVEFDSNDFPTTRTIPMPSTVRSVVANNCTEHYLVINGAGDLLFVDNSGPTLVTTTVAAIGPVARRIRWDPSTGIGGISEFNDGTITVFLWDGITVPTILGTAQVGAGPVGLDVFGFLICCAGFNDDTWSLIEIDPVTMSIMNVSTQALPHPGPTVGPFQPGHAAFLRDVERRVVVSMFGVNELLFISGAHP